VLIDLQPVWVFIVWIFFGFHNALCEEIYVAKLVVAQGRGNFTQTATSEKNITKNIRNKCCSDKWKKIEPNL